MLKVVGKLSRMIPSRVRNQGIELYEQGLIEIISKKENVINALVASNTLQYALDDAQVRCDCAVFPKKKYCEHLAAIEYFLKNDSEGKRLLEDLTTHNETNQETERVTSFGSVFLDGLKVNNDDTIKYQLATQGSQSPYSSEFWWTFKINRLPDNRTYIVRDIKAFLSTIKKESYYQIGKNYYEPLSLLQFDEASQELIRFLWRIIPSGNRIDTDYLLPNHGRHLALTSGFFEEGLILLNDLYDFSFENDNQISHHLLCRHLSGSDNLFSFEVVVHSKSIELIIKEKQMMPLFDNDYLLYQDIVYYLTLKQKKMVSAIRSLPIASDLAKHIYFNSDDQAKLADSLLDFKELGHIKAPKSFEIRDFEASFYLDIADNQEIALKLIFDYGDTKVSSEKEHVNLTFASQYKHEERIFRIIEANGFSPSFESYHAPLSKSELYAFFTKTLPQFSHLGDLFLSPNLEKLQIFEKPRVDIKTQGGLLDVSFDFSGIYENDIDNALTALFNNEAYFISEAGNLIVFDEETQKISDALQNLRAKKLTNGHLQLDTISTFQVSELLGDSGSVHFSKEFQQLALDLAHPEKFDIPLPQVNAELREYQEIGIRWMSMLDNYGFGGVLADDMGLGKTLQTISFLVSKLKPSTRVLIFSPSSLIYNW